jgi:type II secretion system protein C
MNRYQQEVAEMDRRRQVAVRVLSFVGAGCVAVLALWSAGLPPTQWLDAAQGWWAEEESQQPASQRPSPNAPAVTEIETAAVTNARDTAAQGTDSSVSARPLPLYLVATSPGRNKNEGTARIGTSVDNPQTYTGGALLANGARLAEVHKDHVVLTRAGVSAELYLYQRDPRAKQRSSDSALLVVGAEPPREIVVQKVNDGLTDYMRPSPVYDGEVLRGYQVYPGNRSSVFARLGLEPGDVITSINDAPLNEPSQSMELFAQIMRGAAVVATVDRKNSSRRITLDGALISADQESIKEASAAPSPGMPST